MTPTSHPVLIALNDPIVRERLLRHALAVVGRLFASRSPEFRAEQAAEAVQETALQAWRVRNSYDPARPVNAWLHGIMANVLHKVAWVVRRIPPQEPENPADGAQGLVDPKPPPDEAVCNDEVAMLDRLTTTNILNRLPAAQSQVLRLRFLEDLSHPEIAARLGITPAAARVRLCRALIAAKGIAGTQPPEDE